MARLRQYANRVNILKYVKAGDSWRFAPVVEIKGKVVRDHVSIAGEDLGYSVSASQSAEQALYTRVLRDGRHSNQR